MSSGNALWMQVKENGCRDRPDDDQNARQPLNASNAVERSAEVAIAVGILVTVPAQAFARDNHVLGLALRMEFIADVAPTATAGKLINVVRCFGLTTDRGRPVFRRHSK